MNALVSYESSSDDEETHEPISSRQPPPPPPPPPPHGPTAINGDVNVRTADSLSNQMIGPTIPESFDIREGEEPENMDLPEGLSEQDVVRHLTQATHPISALPPSPSGWPNSQAEAKFKRFLELKHMGLNFNEDLAKKSTFRNPALLSTLMDRAGIHGNTQYASSLPPSVWDPTSLPPFAYKEQLLRSQQAIRDQEIAQKKQDSAAGRRKIEFASAGRSGASSRTSTPGRGKDTIVSSG